MFVLALVAAFAALAPGADAQVATEEVTHTSSCLAENGRIDTMVINRTSETADYRLEFQGLTARARTVAAGDWWRMPVTGRPDGDYTVVVKRDGQVISTSTVSVTCDASPASVPGDELVIFDACRDGRGYLLFQFLNDSAAMRSYIIEFEGVPNRSTSAQPYGQAIRAVTGRPDGDFGVLVRSGSTTVFSGDVSVDCTPDVPAVGRIDVRARGRDGSERIELQLNGATVATYDAIGTSYQTFTYEGTERVLIEQLRVAFTNNSPERDADIDYIVVDGTQFQTESAEVYSSGVWDADTGCAPGFKQSETIACNGWVEFQATHGSTLGEPSGPWVLVWNDDFSGDSINTSKWAAFGGNYGNPPRLQVYRTGQENLKVENGSLILRATHDPVTDSWYSGMVHTNDVTQPANPAYAKGNVGWEQGRFEVRAKLPYGKGLWPAIWMRPIDNKYPGSWPYNGEIDILEYLGPQGNVPQAPVESLVSNIHYVGADGVNKQNREEVPVTRAYAEDWHVYAVEWTFGAFRFYVDDEKVHEITSWDSESGYPAPFDQRFDIILNLQVGFWAGTPDPADYPAQMEIDWVRVYDPR